MPTRGRRHSGTIKAVRFCPWCGVENISRDDSFNPANKRGVGLGVPSFICNACCRGFTVGHSPRAQYAAHMIGEDRRLRPHDFEAVAVAKIPKPQVHPK